VRADVHVAQLQRSRKREYEGYEFLLERLLADRLDVGGRSRGQSAC